MSHSIAVGNLGRVSSIYNTILYDGILRQEDVPNSNWIPCVANSDQGRGGP